LLFLGSVNLVNLLLKQGAKVDLIPPVPEPDRPSPLDLSILRGDPGLVRILLEAGIKYYFILSKIQYKILYYQFRCKC